MREREREKERKIIDSYIQKIKLDESKLCKQYYSILVSLYDDDY